MFEQDGVDVAFEMVDGDQGFAERKGEGLGIADADEQRARQAGAVGNGNGVEVAKVNLASASAARTTGTMLRRCSREASSGTTPP